MTILDDSTHSFLAVLRCTKEKSHQLSRQKDHTNVHGATQIREWTGLEFGKSQRAVENRDKMEKTGCKIICGAPTTLAVKGLMMMMIQI